jgi:hypothetical protein
MRLLRSIPLGCIVISAAACKGASEQRLEYRGWNTAMNVDDARRLALRETGSEMSCVREPVDVGIDCLANSKDLPPSRRVRVFFTSDTSKVVSLETASQMPSTVSVDSLRRAFSSAWGPGDTSQVQYPGRERDAQDGLYLGRWARNGDSARVIVFDYEGAKWLHVSLGRIGQVKYSPR